MTDQNIPWEAISARLKNEASAEQQHLLKQWLESSPENSRIFQEIINSWLLTRKLPAFYQPDLTANWVRLMQKIAHHPASRMVYLKWAAAAAVLLIVFLAGIGLGDGFFFPSEKFAYTRIIAPEGQKTQIVLPDSTYVWLNSGSELQYPSDYSSRNRKVVMKGECFFDVVKDKQHPFLVEGEKLLVKVYGTRFNVNEDTESDMADVTLVSGNVKVLSSGQQFMANLLPGQQLLYRNGKFRVQKADNLDALTAWLNNMLIFDNQPFAEIIPYLEKWYGVRIKLDQSLYYSHNYTFKVKTESLREVLELISVITPIDYSIKGDQVTIKYRSQ